MLTTPLCGWTSKSDVMIGNNEHVLFMWVQEFHHHQRIFVYLQPKVQPLLLCGSMNKKGWGLEEFLMK